MPLLSLNRKAGAFFIPPISESRFPFIGRRGFFIAVEAGLTKCAFDATIKARDSG